MLRAAEVLEPQALFIENVPAVERDRGRCVQRVINGLERLGYRVDAKVVSVVDVGVPQLRRRHVLVAHERSAPSLDDAVETARIEAPRPLSWAIADLHDDGSILNSAALLTHENRRRAEYLFKRDLYDLPNWLRPRCQRGPHAYKSMYGRLRWDEPAQTITSGFGSPGQGRYLHPRRVRTLTPHEAARVQFIPDWFDFSLLVHRKHLARAIANAVPPKLAFVVASQLLSIGRARRKETRLGGDTHAGA
jgi:DNA (cytosine-5)-methyltransferase 1